MWTIRVYRNPEPNSFTVSLYQHKTDVEKLNVQVVYTEYICCAVMILIVYLQEIRDHNSLSYAAV